MVALVWSIKREISFLACPSLINYSVNRTNDEIVAIKIIGERIHQKKVDLLKLPKILNRQMRIFYTYSRRYNIVSRRK